MITSYRMLRYWIAGILVLFCFAAVAQTALPPQSIGKRTKPHTVVYKLKTGAYSNGRIAQGTAPTLETSLKKIGGHSIRQKFPDSGARANTRRNAAVAVDLTQLYELQYNPEKSFADVQRELMATGMVEYVEPLYQREPFHQPNDPSADSTQTTQYYLKLMQAYSGWAVQKGDTNIVIGILDTGFRLNHAELKSKIKYNYDDPIDGIDNDGDGYIDNYAGWDMADRDNNVIDDTQYNWHGTAVSGLAVAETNNSLGIAGVGYNTMFMPLKVFPSTPRGSFAGYEAIVYAADRGCSVINLSWGGEGFSQFEQDIINYAVLNRDVVIVAAAGNTNKELNYYPASYDNVISVGGTDAKDIKDKDFTYSKFIDVLAPGRNIHTTRGTGDNSYYSSTGTSLSAPMVSGCAALVRMQFPHFNAQQVAEQIRVTTDDVYNLPGNKPFIGMLGKGRINIKTALTKKDARAVRATAFAIAGNKLAQIGDTVYLEVDFTNFLAPTSNLNVTLSSISPFVKVLQGHATLGSMATMEKTSIRNKPFVFVVTPDAGLNVDAYFRLDFSDGTTYTDFQNIKLPVNPEFITLTANNLKVSINSKGNFGYNGFNFREGVGVQYKDGGSLLFEGGLLVASSATRVSDNIRNDVWQADNDFKIVSATKKDYKTKLATQEIRTVMKDSPTAESNVGVQVKHRAFAWNKSEHQDYVILEYTLTNITADTLTNLKAGLFADWNIGNSYVNAADWDDEHKFGYVYNTSSPITYAGIKLLTHDAPTYYAIDNIGGGSNTITIADGFTAEEKYKTLSGGIARKRAWGNGTGNDVAHVVGASIGSLAPGATKTVAFAVMASEELAVMQTTAAAAQQQYYSIKTGAVPVAIQDTLCAGSTAVVTPKEGQQFKYYEDSNRTKLLGTGNSYTIPQLTANKVVYVSNADSLFESAAIPASITASAVIAKFSMTQEPLYNGQDVGFSNQSSNSNSWHWDFGNGHTSSEKNPYYTYPAPGTYEVKMVAANVYGCTDTVSHTLDVRFILPNAVADRQEALIQVYPNPTTGILKINLSGIQRTGAAPEILLTDMLGKVTRPVIQTYTDQEAVIDLSGLASGVYVARISYNKSSFTKKIILTKP